MCETLRGLKPKDRTFMVTRSTTLVLLLSWIHSNKKLPTIFEAWWKKSFVFNPLEKKKKIVVS